VCSIHFQSQQASCECALILNNPPPVESQSPAVVVAAARPVRAREHISMSMAPKAEAMVQQLRKLGESFLAIAHAAPWHGRTYLRTRSTCLVHGQAPTVSRAPVVVVREFFQTF
jgi:hypothetical protein